MAKKIIQDVLIKQKKEKPKPVQETKVKNIGKRSFLKKIFWFCFIVVIISLGGVILVNFSSAVVKITPHQEFINIDKQLSLNFETIQLEKEDSQAGPATEVATGGQKARGQIIIYNTYSSKSQKLTDQTRFETPDKKIYKTLGAVVVPGNGSLEVLVYADKTGPEYNIGLKDFTIPGFKGTPKYTKIYGRSKTEMSGGTNQDALIISKKDIDNAKNNLKQKIENYLKENITQQKPAEYLLYKNALKIDFSDDSSNPKVGDIANNFIFKEKGKAIGFLLKKSDLSKALAENRENASVVNLEDLNFNFLSENATATEITFTLKGTAHLVWNVDTNSLVGSLLNIKDKNYKAVFEKYPDIERAEIVFKPVWWTWMPHDKSRLHFEIVLK
ncbi:MAG: hypothetical protein NTX55_02225 [Candidatus Parcubacteria bacterium]|nr:hypothetical protein [Candidatus Parcubacteria bacterium]